MSFEQAIKDQQARRTAFSNAENLLKPLLELIPLLTREELEVAVGRVFDALNESEENADLKIKASVLANALKNRPNDYQPPKLQRLLKFTDAENFMARFLSANLNLPLNSQTEELRTFAELLSSR